MIRMNHCQRHMHIGPHRLMRLSINENILNWAFNEKFDSYAKMVLNGATGINVDQTDIIPGIIGNAVDLNGVDEAVSYASAPDVGANDFAVAFWVKTVSAGTDFLVSNINRDNDDSTGWIVKHGNGRLQVVVRNGATRSAGSFSSGAAFLINSGNWTHVAYNFDRSGNCTAYVNTVSAGNINISAANGSLTNAIPLMVGADYKLGGYFSYFPGAVDDLFIFKRLLSLSDINALYRRSL